MADSKILRDKELAALREKRLTTLFNRHFSEAAAAITAERKAAEVALREIERRRAEAALKLATGGDKKSSDAGQTLTKLDEMYLELKRRSENVRKRERETLEKYHRFCQKGGMNNGGVSTIPSTEQSNTSGWNRSYHSNYKVGQADASSKGVGSYLKVSELDTGHVDKNVRKFSNKESSSFAMKSSPSRPLKTETGNVKLTTDKWNSLDHRSSNLKSSGVLKNPKTIYKSSVPTKATDANEHIDSSSTNFKNAQKLHNQSPTQARNQEAKTRNQEAKEQIKSPTEKKKTLTDEETLFLNAQKAADLAEKDGKEEETMLSVLSSKSVDGEKQGDEDSDNLTTTSYGNSSFGGSITTATSQASSLVFITEAEMRLTAFLKANTEALASISHHVQSTSDQYDLDSQSIYSEKARIEYNSAVSAAEKAAKDMADAVAWTNAKAKSNSSVNVNKQKKKEKWFQYWSEEHSREYYYQPSTGKVVWDPPAAFEDSGTKLKDKTKSVEEQELLSEDERMKYDVQNWSIDDFLPERKGKKGKIKKSRRLSSFDDNMSIESRGSRGSKSSRISRGSRSSRSSRGSRRTRSGRASHVFLPKAIFSSPTKDYSLWNSRNRKLRKKVVRRTFWGIVMTGVIYKTGTSFTSYYYQSKNHGKESSFWDDKGEKEFSGPAPIVDTAIEDVKKEQEWIKKEKLNDALEELVPIDSNKKSGIVIENTATEDSHIKRSKDEKTPVKKKNFKIESTKLKTSSDVEQDKIQVIESKEENDLRSQSVLVSEE